VDFNHPIRELVVINNLIEIQTTYRFQTTVKETHERPFSRALTRKACAMFMSGLDKVF